MSTVKLLEDWKQILKKAWSIRLILIAGLLSGAEVILPLFVRDIPRGLFSAIALPVTAAAFAARIMAQKGLTK